MAIYFYWGEDTFARDRAVELLQSKTLDQSWASFNLDRIGPDYVNGIVHALNQAMTPPFGMGGRFILLSNTTIGQRCSVAVSGITAKVRSSSANKSSLQR